MNFDFPDRVTSLGDSMIRLMTIEAHKYSAINMGQGCPEFDPDKRILDAAENFLSIPIKNQYSEDRGAPELREAIAKKYKHFYNWEIDAEKELTVVCGVTEAIIAAVLALVKPNEKVVIIEPAHENYLAATLFAGARPVWVPLTAPEFRLDLNRVEDAFKAGGRYIILNTPHNPTGRVFSPDELTGLAELCVKYDVIAITDEIYEHIIYDGKKHLSLALLPGMKERTITTSGIGKTYSLTGWRIGYIITPDFFTQAIRRVHTFLSICAPTPLQHAAVTALNLPGDYYTDLLKKYSASRDKMMEILTETGLRAEQPEGAYYVMADFSKISDEDDLSFSYKMVREVGVAVIPGSSFYCNKEHGRKLVRFAFPKPISILEEAHRRLQKGLHIS